MLTAQLQLAPRKLQPDNNSQILHAVGLLHLVPVPLAISSVLQSVGSHVANVLGKLPQELRLELLNVKLLSPSLRSHNRNPIPLIAPITAIKQCQQKPARHLLTWQVRYQQHLHQHPVKSAEEDLMHIYQSTFEVFYMRTFLRTGKHKVSI
jgi:hypothetical protein